MVFVKNHFIKDTNNICAIETMIRKNRYRFNLIKKYNKRSKIYHKYVMNKCDGTGVMNDKIRDMRIRLYNFQDMLTSIISEALENKKD